MDCNEFYQIYQVFYFLTFETEQEKIIPKPDCFPYPLFCMLVYRHFNITESLQNVGNVIHSLHTQK